MPPVRLIENGSAVDEPIVDQGLVKAAVERSNGRHDVAYVTQPSERQVREWIDQVTSVRGAIIRRERVKLERKLKQKK